MKEKLFTSNKWAICVSFMFLWTSAFSQSDGYYIHLNNSNIDRTVLTSNFATEINKDELIYTRIEHRFEGLNSESKTVSWLTKMIKSKKDGTILKSVLVESDSLELFDLNVYRFNDFIILNGIARSETVNYFISIVYDLDLTQLSTEIFPYVKTSYFEYTSLGSAMVKYTNERMYLVYESDAKYFIYDNEGKVEKTGTLRNPKNNNNAFNLQEYAIDPKTGDILGYGWPSSYRFDKDFNFKSYKFQDNRNTFDTQNWNKIYSGYEYIASDQYLGWGRCSYRDTVKKEIVMGLSLAIFNSDLEPVENISFIDFNLEESSDVSCRTTGGLFKGTDGYYTFGEAVPIIPGENGHVQSSYFFVNKYDFELNTVWQRKFIFRKDYRFLQLHAELTVDNAILIAGENWDISKATHWPYHIGGHIINLGTDGNFYTLGTNKDQSGIVFSVMENPVQQNFSIIKNSDDPKNYEVKIFDIQGRQMSSSDRWVLGQLGIDVSAMIAGTYIYTIGDGKRIVHSGKFIKI
jgi:hypothetical protein